MTPEQKDIVLKGMWGVVNNGGTAGAIKMANFDIAGKTGTAQDSSLGNDSGATRTMPGSFSFAPAYKPEIAVHCADRKLRVRRHNAAPAVKGVYEAYLAKETGI